MRSWKMAADPDFMRALRGARLTTAEVLYYMPDHPQLLQSFLWQTYDAAPDYPRLMKFLDHWRRRDRSGHPLGARRPCRAGASDETGAAPMWSCA
jgi:uncharacterized protein Usg